ncbi:MAG: hypothetical protein ABI333_19590 [bacterium]
MITRAALPTVTVSAVILATLGGVTCGVDRIRRFPRRPVLRVDDDRRDVATPPAVTQQGRWASALEAQLTEPLERLLAVRSGGRARNVNSLGEVPDSTWFRNRNHRRALSLSVVRRGAARTPGPSLLGPWQVEWTARTRTGLRVAIRDEQSHRFTLSFDAKGHPRLATTAELVATLLLHTLGFHVPERHLVLFEPSQLRLTAGSRHRRADGRSRKGDPRLHKAGLSRLLRGLPKLRDGSLRALATRLDGSLDLGPFRFRGRRRDDPNDFVAHERRRELRGLAAVAALLNLTTVSRVGRDRYVRQRPRHVIHRLERLRGALGSTPAGRPKPLWEGFAPLFDPRRMAQQALTFGLVRSAWMDLARHRRRQLRRWPALGWLPAERFRTADFSPRLSNPAFAAADDEDRFWGARLIASLTARQLRAAVQEALLPEDEARRLVHTLLLRRRSVLRHSLGRRAPLDDFRLIRSDPTRLCFTDLWRREGLGGPALVTYELRLRSDRGIVPGTRARHLARNELVCVIVPPVRRTAQDDGYRVLEIRRPGISPAWVRIHLRSQPGLAIAGLER